MGSRPRLYGNSQAKLVKNACNFGVLDIFFAALPDVESQLRLYKRTVLIKEP